MGRKLINKNIRRSDIGSVKMSNSPRSPRKSGESKQLSVTPQTRSRRSSSISILDGRPLPPDSCPRPKITWAKGVEFLEHDCSIVIKTVNGKRVSKHPLLQGREPPKPKSGMLFTTGQKVEMYSPKSDKWTIARVRGKVRRRNGWHYALRAGHKDLTEHVPSELLRPVKEYDLAEDHHLIRHMGWTQFKELFDIPNRGLFRSNKKLKELVKHESCPFGDDGSSGSSDDWENSGTFQGKYNCDNPKSLKNMHHGGSKKKSSTGMIVCLILILILVCLGIFALLVAFGKIELGFMQQNSEARRLAEVFVSQAENVVMGTQQRRLAVLERLGAEIQFS